MKKTKIEEHREFWKKREPVRRKKYEKYGHISRTTNSTRKVMPRKFYLDLQ